MKFTIVSHAGLLVESAGTSLMMDPWIVGSCYWRSWWNYPKPAAFATQLTDLDYVYLTHMHWDHFHGPSLRKLPRSATLLIPEAHFPRMRKDAEIFRFREIVELPHGKTVALKNGLEITSYQYSLFMDTAVAVSDGSTTLLNMNDCKIAGRALRQLVSRHPKIDFVFRSHSSASAYPWCVKSEDPDALGYRTNEDYMSEFANTARLVSARHAIPFASLHCFLHRDTAHFNDTVVSPEDVRSYFDRNGPEGCKCVVMIPNDSWSDSEGFQLQDHDYYTRKKEHIADYAREKAPLLEAHYAMEDQVEVSFRAFKKYFQAQVESVPRITRRLFRPVVVFGLPNRPEIHWVVDFDRREVYEQDHLPENWAIRVVIHPAILKDCIYKRMFATFSASKRLSIEIRRGATRDYLIFFQLLDMFEYDFFPLRKLFRPRFLKVWLRRWREVLDYFGLLARILFGRGDPLAKFVPRITTGSDSR
jgi:UDP-MurNAc hydroxylase